MKILSWQQISDEQWDAFCDASPETWGRHRSMSRHGMLADPNNSDHSFGIMQNGVLMAIAPLILRAIPDTHEREFAYSRNMATPAPALAQGLFLEKHEELLQECMRETDQRAIRLDAVRARIFIDPLTRPMQVEISTQNPLAQFGYTDASTIAYVIDLSKKVAVFLFNQ